MFTGRATTWDDDVEFGRQAIAGMHACALKAVTDFKEFQDTCSILPEHVAGLLEQRSLQVGPSRCMRVPAFACVCYLLSNNLLHASMNNAGHQAKADKLRLRQSLLEADHAYMSAQGSTSTIPKKLALNSSPWLVSAWVCLYITCDKREL